ncbi:F-box/kelch-repeat protein At3g23880-like [Tripterygium wilfordii]|uniref:F-box/kelch-repeat protein At3g23880-like n=1 Tax=Tripterygium wilfordii TaxID=458696 RepID=UPI0018F7FFE7|nr:F-box/kelch-repeat protein At3g23880-like [Tripterygium wilfordii]
MLNHKLNDQVLENILLHLPAKSLLDFRYVCKSWYALITSPVFISNHTDLTIKNSESDNNDRKLIIKSFSKDDKKKERYSLHHVNESFGMYDQEDLFPFESRFDCFKIIGSINGVFCLCDTRFDRLPKPLILWNSIGLSLTLPMPNIHHGFTVTGFGYHRERNDFKVIRILYDKNGSGFGGVAPTKVEVFAVSVGEWSGNIVDRAAPTCSIPANLSQAYLNGVVHWIGYHCPGNEKRALRKWFVATFDVGGEFFGEIEMPDEIATQRMSEAAYFYLDTYIETLALLKGTNRVSEHAGSSREIESGRTGLSGEEENFENKKKKKPKRVEE